MRVLGCTVLALSLVLSGQRAADGQVEPPIPEEPTRPVWIRLSKGRSVEGRLLGHDERHHFVRTADGVFRIRMADVEVLRFDAPPPPPPPTASNLPSVRTRRDLRVWMVALGSALFGLTYLGSVAGMEKADRDGGHLAIPVLGPFAYAMATNQGGEAAGLLTFVSFVQAGGMALLLVGLASGPPEPQVDTGPSSLESAAGAGSASEVPR